MIIFLYGPDTYRSREKLNEMIEHYKEIHKGGLSLKYFYGEDLNFEDFRDETQQGSIFDEKKLIVLTDVFSNQDFKEKFLKNSQKFLNSKDIILFYEESTPRVDRLFEFLKQKTKSQEFELLRGEKLKNWTIKKLANYQTKISPAALENLINFVGNDLWQLNNEIKKLVSFKKPPVTTEGAKIELEDVELLVKPTIETDIFKTIDALALKNKKRAIVLLHKHLEKGDSPSYLLSMINFQFRNLLMIKSQQLSKERTGLQLHPYVIKKTTEQARNFSLEELKKIYQKIFQVDLSIKTGKIEPKVALDLLLTEIC